MPIPLSEIPVIFRSYPATGLIAHCTHSPFVSAVAKVAVRPSAANPPVRALPLPNVMVPLAAAGALRTPAPLLIVAVAFLLVVIKGVAALMPLTIVWAFDDDPIITNNKTRKKEDKLMLIRFITKLFFEYLNC